ncbi:MAG: hypothetical protein ACK4TF_02330 [Thermodesulfovibrionales bacterium]
MKTETYYKLKDLSKKYGSSNFGKIVQCLCALSFYEELNCPPEKMNVNLVEGVDIIVEEPKYAIEVKTTSGERISFQEKDFEGYERYTEYTSLFCILKIGLFSKLLLIKQGKLKRKKNWSINELYEDDDLKNLSKKINERFEQLIENNFTEISKNGLQYLLKQLRNKNIRYAGI